LSARVTQGLQTISMAGSGDFSNHPNLGRLTMTVTGPRRVTMQAVLTGTRIYLTSDLFHGQLPEGKTWLSLDFGKAGKALGIDMSAMGAQAPSSTLAQLRASGKVTTVGHATIGGVATTHYSAVVDLDRLAKVSNVLHVDVSYAPIDVWVDAKGLVRKLHMSYIQGAHDTLPETVTDMTMTLSRYGEDVSVRAPAAYETFDATDLAAGLLKK
jgi:hypothetical protein